MHSFTAIIGIAVIGYHAAALPAPGVQAIQQKIPCGDGRPYKCPGVEAVGTALPEDTAPHTSEFGRHFKRDGNKPPTGYGRITSRPPPRPHRPIPEPDEVTYQTEEDEDPERRERFRQQVQAAVEKTMEAMEEEEEKPWIMDDGNPVPPGAEMVPNNPDTTVGAGKGGYRVIFDGPALNGYQPVLLMGSDSGPGPSPKWMSRIQHSEWEKPDIYVPRPWKEWDKWDDIEESIKKGFETRVRARIEREAREKLKMEAEKIQRLENMKKYGNPYGDPNEPKRQLVKEITAEIFQFYTSPLCYFIPECRTRFYDALTGDGKRFQGFLPKAPPPYKDWYEAYNRKNPNAMVIPPSKDWDEIFAIRDNVDDPDAIPGAVESVDQITKNAMVIPRHQDWEDIFTSRDNVDDPDAIPGPVESVDQITKNAMVIPPYKDWDDVFATRLNVHDPDPIFDVAERYDPPHITIPIDEQGPALYGYEDRRGKYYKDHDPQWLYIPKGIVPDTQPDQLDTQPDTLDAQHDPLDEQPFRPLRPFTCRYNPKAPQCNIEIDEQTFKFCWWHPDAPQCVGKIMPSQRHPLDMLPPTCRFDPFAPECGNVPQDREPLSDEEIIKRLRNDVNAPKGDDWKKDKWFHIPEDIELDTQHEPLVPEDGVPLTDEEIIARLKNKKPPPPPPAQTPPPPIVPVHMQGETWRQMEENMRAEHGRIHKNAIGAQPGQDEPVKSTVDEIESDEGTVKAVEATEPTATTDFTYTTFTTRTPVTADKVSKHTPIVPIPTGKPVRVDPTVPEPIADS